MNNAHPQAPHTILIVGAGYSGSITAANLLRHNPGSHVRILLAEHLQPAGRGLAYRTWDDNLLLNVPAGNMSAFGDAPQHFVEFCREIDPAFNAGSFIPRRIYGDYLAHSLQESARQSNASLQTLDAAVVHIERRDAGFIAVLDSGTVIAADQIVLAVGHLPPGNPLPADACIEPARFIVNPWDFAALNRIDADRDVLLIGSGHTATDTLFRLAATNATRRFFLLSRRGLLPHGHRSQPKSPAAVDYPSYLQSVPVTVRALSKALRNETRRREAAGSDWRDVLNELRPHLPTLWEHLALAERRRFLRHAVPFWDIHRHRLAPSAYKRLHDMIETGYVESIAGRIRSVRDDGESVHVTLRGRGQTTLRELSVGAVVNCTGPNYDIAAAPVPLLAQLRDDGLLRQDPLKLGLEVDDTYQLLDRHRQPTPNLFYIGPMLKAHFWEAIAVPELRMHAQRLSRQVLARSE